MKCSALAKRLLPYAASSLLAFSVVSAQAHGRWFFDIDVAVPLVLAVGAVSGALPVGAVSVSYGGGRYWHHRGVWYRPWGPRWVVVAPPLGIVVPLAQPLSQPIPQPATEALPPAPPSKPDPVIYPRNGQDAQQTEADRQECNRWATTQPSALADAAVFQRAVEACMDGRGYTLK